jgi:hypothetical protein
VGGASRKTQMNKAQDRIYNLRVILARSNRGLLRSVDGQPEYKGRATRRRWLRRLLRTDAIRRVAAACSDIMTLYSLANAMYSLSEPPEKSLKQLAQDRARIRSDVDATVRTLRSMATREPERASALLDLAQEVDSNFFFGHQDPSTWHDYSLVGQKGDRRAFVIRELDRIIPSTTDFRFAAIVELLSLYGFKDTSPQLVRSTLLNGRT